MDEILRKFMLTGKIAFLELGLHRREVEQHFPDLWQHLTNKTRRTTLFLVGSLGLFFQRSFLTSIEIHFSSRPVRLPEKIYSREFVDDYPKTLAEFTKYLNEKNIPFRRLGKEDYIIFGDTDVVHFHIEPGIFVYFVDSKTKSISRSFVQDDREKFPELYNLLFG